MADKSKEKKAEKKIILETSADLYKLPVNIIKTAKIYNYQGKYFEKLYKEALEIESGISQNKQTVIKNQQDSNNQNIQSNQNRRKIDIRIDRIVFQMKYQTIMGQELGVIGSLNDIGNWDQNKAQKLRWTDGNVWI